MSTETTATPADPCTLVVEFIPTGTVDRWLGLMSGVGDLKSFHLVDGRADLLGLLFHSEAAAARWRAVLVAGLGTPDKSGVRAVS